MKQHPQNVTAYLDNMYAPGRRQYACLARDHQSFDVWQAAARPAFHELLRLPRIGADTEGHTVTTGLTSDREDMGDYFRQQGWIETEPHVRISFWFLIPKGEGPFPLAITPHGHENGNTYVGIWHNQRSQEQVEREDQDIAVQAVTRGFLTIAPAMRGFRANPESFKIADIANRHHGNDCRCHNWQVIVAGRTMLGERVWDLIRILDWALQLPEVIPGRTLMIGNSGGGMATLHTAAVDERVTIAVPCGSYNNYISPHGTLRHCPCNAIPNIMDFGEFWDVAGLVAPRRMLTVNGNQDALHPTDEVDRAVEALEQIYMASGNPDHYEHRYGMGGHRFYSDLTWPWIDQSIQKLK